MFHKFYHLKFRFVSDWSETDASPDIRIWDLAKEMEAKGN
ncbi:MAG: hypothetical protein H6Q41_993 [Deltaproteobacteria bacterium]|nr:hypothetical protein [Deltaproteobacteria bacterium]